MIVRDPPVKYREFYVVFTDSAHLRPWHIFTFGRWKHCWLFIPAYLGPPGLLTEQKVIRVNALSTYIDLDFWEGTPDQVSKEFLQEKNVVDIVKISLPLVKKSSYNIRGILNCVTIVKSFLGLKCWWIMTPKQLRRHLLSLGGKSLRSESCQQL